VLGLASLDAVRVLGNLRARRRDEEQQGDVWAGVASAAIVVEARDLAGPEAAAQEPGGLMARWTPGG
jgi:hypothetical protein